jgi:O-antigen/teichoic acid export membrane protein
MSPAERSPTELSRPERLSDETRLAVRNASKLGLSLMATWGVAVLVRLYLPRHLGPEAFGLYSFAESFTLTCFAFLSLGVDGYSLREIAARPDHASDFFGGLVIVRLILGVLLIAGSSVLLVGTGPTGAPRLVAIFGIGYMFFSIGNSLAAFLQANATVDQLAVANVVAKVLWGGLMATALVLGAPLPVLAAVLAVSEGARAAILYCESQRRLGLSFKVDRRATAHAIWAAVPYFATAVALNLNRFDVTVLGFMAGNQEVGWYGAAGNFSMLVFLLFPLMSSVLLPTMRRVHARSEAGLWHVIHRVTEGIIVACVPLALLVGLGADVWVQLAFGREFLSAAPSLRVLAVQALLTYMASLTALTLIVLGRRWTVTMTSVLGLVVNPAIGVTLIPIFGRLFGPGGAGAGAAMGAIGAEAVVLGVQGAVLGPLAFRRQTRSLAVRCLLLSAGTVVLHVLLAPLGPLRLAADAVAYVVVGIPLGVLPVREVTGLARELLSSRREPSAEANP